MASQVQTAVESYPGGGPRGEVYQNGNSFGQQGMSQTQNYTMQQSVIESTNHPSEEDLLSSTYDSLPPLKENPDWLMRQLSSF